MLRKIILILAVLFAIFIVFIYGVSFYLSPQDKLQKSDAIVVISGGNTNSRISEGVKVYKEGFAKKIIFSGAAAKGSVSNAKAMKNIAVKSGVPTEDILIEEKSKTTEENAEFTAKIAKENNYKKIILITSPYHQRRAFNEFKKAYGEDFTIINHSAYDENWRKKDWWSSETARFLTIGEILKNLYSILN